MINLWKKLEYLSFPEVICLILDLDPEEHIDNISNINGSLKIIRIFKEAIRANKIFYYMYHRGDILKCTDAVHNDDLALMMLNSSKPDIPMFDPFDKAFEKWVFYDIKFKYQDVQEFLLNNGIQSKFFESNLPDKIVIEEIYTNKNHPFYSLEKHILFNVLLEISQKPELLKGKTPNETIKELARKKIDELPYEERKAFYHRNGDFKDETLNRIATHGNWKQGGVSSYTTEQEIQNLKIDLKEFE